MMPRYNQQIAIHRVKASLVSLRKFTDVAALRQSARATFEAALFTPIKSGTT